MISVISALKFCLPVVPFLAGVSVQGALRTRFFSKAQYCDTKIEDYTNNTSVDCRILQLAQLIDIDCMLLKRSERKLNVVSETKWERPLRRWPCIWRDIDGIFAARNFIEV